MKQPAKATLERNRAKLIERLVYEEILPEDFTPAYVKGTKLDYAPNEDDPHERAVVNLAHRYVVWLNLDDRDPMGGTLRRELYSAPTEAALQKALNMDGLADDDYDSIYKLMMVFDLWRGRELKATSKRAWTLR